MKTTANAPLKEILDVLRPYKRGIARVAERAEVWSQAVSQWLAGRSTAQNIREAARTELARFPRLTGSDPGRTSKINKLRCQRRLGAKSSSEDLVLLGS